jgi:hypothetical protein
VNLQGIFDKAKGLLGDNSSAILTAVGVTGTITTAYLTGRASFKAAEIIFQKEWIAQEHLSRKEKIELVWPHYISPAVAGATTVGSIIFANRMASKEIAALALASSISERAFQEYKAKVVEKLGSTKDTAIRDEVAQDRVNANPPSTREVILAGTGEVLCFDMLTGRYFQSTVEEIKKAENTVNYDIVNHMYASLSMFYDEIGLPSTPYSDTVGWNVNNRCEVKFSTVMSTDNRPCIAVDFHFLPIAEYARLY